MKIVIMEPLGIDQNALKNLLSNLDTHDITIYDTKTTVVDELIDRAKDADVLVIANNPLPDVVIDKCCNLKMISVAFVGIDHIGLAPCKARNIRISNAAGYCTYAVSELAMGLTLSVLRNIPRCDVRSRTLKSKDGLIGNELFGKTFGIIGTGAIGLQTARVAKAFGCNIIAYSRTTKVGLEDLLEYVSLEELMKQSDIVSVHTPLTPETKGLIDHKYLNLMKATAIIINTARGPIIDNQYLSEMLSAHKIAGAGIDVFDVEPPLSSSDVLIQNETAVLTPHVAYATKESILRRASIVIENIEKWIEGAPQNVML